MNGVLAVVFAAAGMWQIDQRARLFDRADIVGRRRLIVTMICWGFTVALVAT